MKEMKYQSEELAKPEVLLDRFGNGHRILILSFGTHPCAYVGVPSDHPLAGFSYMDLLHLIDCHGGLTFSDEGDGEARPKGYFWYGWDYAHSGDYTGYLGDETEKKWTTDEICEEAEYVVQQFKELANIVETAIARKCG